MIFSPPKMLYYQLPSFNPIYDIVLSMKSNIWNLRSSKERLDILQKTQAHKRHLIGLLSAKSKVNTYNSMPTRHPSCTINLLRKKIIADDNRTLARKIATLARPSPPSHQRLNTSLSLSRSLKNYSSVNRTMKQKSIDRQNSKMLSRLVTTSATLQRQKWMQSNQQIVKYKENLHRSKYRQPDYSNQACKLISRDAKFKCLYNSKKGLQKRSKIL